jgi:hypothetical protein
LAAVPGTTKAAILKAKHLTAKDAKDAKDAKEHEGMHDWKWGAAGYRLLSRFVRHRD